jgi:hypothetical protein
MGAVVLSFARKMPAGAPALLNPIKLAFLAIARSFFFPNARNPNPLDLSAKYSGAERKLELPWTIAKSSRISTM